MSVDTGSRAPRQLVDAGSVHLERVRSGRADLLAVAGFLLLTILLFRAAWRSPTTTWVGEPGDPPLFMWFLRWMPHALATGENPFFTYHLNSPDGVNLMWNTAVPLAALVLTPITLAAGPVFSYNVLITSAVALSGASAYVMLRRYVRSRAAAFAGGLLYGFSPYMYAHAREHPNLAAAFVPPLLVLLLDEILVRQRRSPVRTGLVLGAVAFAQLMLSEELLATQVLVAALALAALVALHPREVRARARHACTALAVAAGSSLALAAFPLVFQLWGPGRVRSGPLWGPDFFVSDLLGFVIPTQHLLFSPAWAEEITRDFTNACCPSEWSAYLGVPLLLLLVVAAARLWSRAVVRTAAVVATAVLVLSMGPHLHVGGFVSPMPLPFDALDHLPLIGNMLAERLMLYVYLMAAVLVAVVIDHLVSENGRPLLATAVAAVALVPLVPNPHFPATTAVTPSFFRSEAVKSLKRDTIALVAPFPRDTSTSLPMLWQAESDMHFRMPAGYALGPDRTGRFSFLPVPTVLSTRMQEIQRGAPASTISASERALLLADLARAGVETVVVGPMAHREEMTGFFRDLLGREPVLVEGIALWSGGPWLSVSDVQLRE